MSEMALVGEPSAHVPPVVKIAVGLYVALATIGAAALGVALVRAESREAALEARALMLEAECVQGTAPEGRP